MYGFRHELSLKLRHLGDLFKWWFFYRNSDLSKKEFVLNGKSYRYLVHHYNSTWANERAVEIPVAAELLRSAKGKQILEIGNVLSHYFPVEHQILDKYEHSLHPKVQNCDLLDYAPERLFDLILSISTMEHVGWDEEPRDPQKVLRFTGKIRSLLNKGGEAWITIPVGYNTFLDDELRRGTIQFSEVYGLIRISRENEWKTADLGSALACRYHSPFPCANGMVFGVLRNE